MASRLVHDLIFFKTNRIWMKPRLHLLLSVLQGWLLSVCVGVGGGETSCQCSLESDGLEGQCHRCGPCALTQYKNPVHSTWRDF